jgi:hypothetical protein
LSYHVGRALRAEAASAAVSATAASTPLTTITTIAADGGTAINLDIHQFDGATVDQQ